MPIENKDIEDLTTRLRVFPQVGVNSVNRIRNAIQLIEQAADMLEMILDIARKFDKCPGMLCPKCGEKKSS